VTAGSARSPRTWRSTRLTDKRRHGGSRFACGLPEEDLEGLSNLSDARHKAEDTSR